MMVMDLLEGVSLAERLRSTEGAAGVSVAETAHGQGGGELHAPRVAVGYSDQKIACIMHRTKPILGLVVQNLVQVMVSVPLGALQALWHGP